ncbi:MAG: RdgB/HAM1 family non-canonical purine NTP pyrophosphatase [Elusimicrobiota bacterium]
MKLLLATGNPHKVREISEILGRTGVELLSLKDLPGLPHAEEDGSTLEENARKKAVQAAEASGLWAMADDTGLEVEALGGAPGIHAARYAGEGCTFADNVRKLLRELQGVPRERRGAAFRCVVALCGPGRGCGQVLSGYGKCSSEGPGLEYFSEGRLEGVILEKEAGSGGFGYDPVFFIPSAGKTLAEMSAEEKNLISHRALALRAMAPRLKELARS